jgi:hypothetical protein
VGCAVNTGEAWALVAIVSGLCLVLGIAGAWIDRRLERERARAILREADKATERRGSVAEFYRLTGNTDKHKRRWAA